MIEYVISALTIVTAVLAVFLIILILLQKSKSAGGLGSLGGEVGESLFGAGTSNVLRRTTVVLATGFFLITLILAVLTGRRPSDESVVESAGQSGPVSEELSVPQDEPPPSDETDNTADTETGGDETEDSD